MHGVELILSTQAPVREGYIFLGWAVAEDPDEVAFAAGDTYASDEDLYLIAVWEKVTLEKLEIKQLPKKTTYFVGEILDTTGLRLIATYSDGTTKTIKTADGITYSPEILNTVGTQTITASYEGKTIFFEVTVLSLKGSGSIRVESTEGNPGDTITVSINSDYAEGEQIIPTLLK